MINSKILDKINSPEDVKKLPKTELSALADEIREFLINSVSKTGGHLASNLGIVELTLAIYHAFDLDVDSLIWDVGHQSYVHKLLTGRMKDFHKLRSFGGISGFPKTCESKYDFFNTGHSSTSISAALGFARANRLLGRGGHSIAVIGDGAFTGGMAFEAFCDAGASRENITVILNDNEMSISKNVGSISNYLTQLRAKGFYLRIKSSIEETLSKLGRKGKKRVVFLKKVKDAIRHIIMPQTFFEELGFTYLGPIDGHNISALISILENSKNISGPVLIHIITKKGKGYSFAENKPSKFHGVGEFEVETGEAASKASSDTYSKVFGETLLELAEENPRICAITAAMPDGTGLFQFSQKYPDRFFDVGISEQHAVTMSAGLAAGGMCPVCALYSSFMQRAYDQVLHDCCLQNLDVVFAIDRAGIVGHDGETHQGIFDISFLSAMPNIAILAPSSFDDLRQMLRYALNEHKGPIAIRYPRGNMGNIEKEPSVFSFSKAELISDGDDVLIISVGHMLSISCEVAKKLNDEGISTALADLKTIKPIDREFLLNASSKYKLIVSIEDGIINGGAGSLILDLLLQNNIKVPLLRIAHQNAIVPQGSASELYSYCGLSKDKIAQRIKNEFDKLRG